MSTRKWLAVSALLLFFTALVFAGGNKDNQTNTMMGPGSNGGMGSRGGMDMQNMETMTMEGTFSMVDGQYPALVTAEGKTFYLMMRYRVDSGDVPAEGAVLKLEVAKSRMSPDVLMVFGGEVDGKKLTVSQPGKGGNRGPEGCAGGGCGMMGGHQGGRGGMSGKSGGSKPGWGYPDTPKS